MRFKQHICFVLLAALVIGTPLYSFTFTLPAYADSIKQNTGSFSNFKTIRTLKKYSDLKSTDKNYKYLKFAYELGLINDRNSGKKIEPNAYITIADTVQAASQINSLFRTGKVVKGSGIDYAITNGIINKADYPNMNKFATRAELAGILAHALPHDYMVSDQNQVHPDIKNNSVTGIPDCDSNTKNYDSIKLLYQGGIMKGVDSKGSFKPNANITRAEASAMLNNIVKPGDRKVFTQTSGKTVDSTVVATPAQTSTGFYQPFKGTVVKKGTQLWYNNQLKNDGGQYYLYGGKSHYSKEDIKTRFGTHLYGCETQREYDELLLVMDRAWAKYQAGIAERGYSGDINYEAARKNLDTLNLGPEYSDLYKYAADKYGESEEFDKLLGSVGALYFMPPHVNPKSMDEDNRSRCGNAETEAKINDYYNFNTIVGQEFSAMHKNLSTTFESKGSGVSKSLFDRYALGGIGDCETSAFEQMLICDYLGINNRMVGSKTGVSGGHAYVEAELNTDRGVQWVGMDGSVGYGNGAINEVAQAPTKATTTHKNLISGRVY